MDILVEARLPVDCVFFASGDVCCASDDMLGEWCGCSGVVREVGRVVVVVGCWWCV